MKKLYFFTLLFIVLISISGFSQTIYEYDYNVNNGDLSNWYNHPGNIIYATGYTAYDYKTPVVFVHGITGKVSNSYKANIDQARSYGLHAAFVQLNPLGTPEQNGKLLKRMIDRITAHYNSATVSIVAHSKGGMDTERALYGRNPYNNSIPSFGYEKVDGVYTFSSPLRGSRVADVGAALSWTGIAFIAMWYTNGYQLTSGSVNSFHNWAQGWRINSYTTFRNYYNPNGASYSRINMIEDNTTRWWAHQSNDPCYQNKWYYCYVGNAFHHTAGAYYDAYWEWDWFNSGWRNWHTSNDGFIAEYRAKRSIITNNSNALTPDAGDTNYRVMHDANHTSLWERGENHFSREVAPYLHRGLYGGRSVNSDDDKPKKQEVTATTYHKVILRSNGNAYFSKNGSTSFIIEEDNQNINLIFYTPQRISQFEISNANRSVSRTYEIIDTKKDDLTTAYQSVGHIANLPKGIYTLNIPTNDFLVMAEYEDTTTAFAVNMNYDEHEGYNNQLIDVAIAQKDDKIDFSKVQVTATVNLVSLDGEQPVAVSHAKVQTFTLQPDLNRKGHFTTRFSNLRPGAVYGVRISATSTDGEVLLSRNIINTFYVKQNSPVHNIDVADNETQSVISNDMIAVYPNPAKDFVSIAIENNTDANISIYNVSGMLVKHIETEKTETKINISNFASGMYLVKIKTQGQIFVKQLLVK